MKENENLCILLGAGVSVEQNLPVWLDLVKDTVKFYSINIGEVNTSNLLETVGVIENNVLSDINLIMRDEHIKNDKMQMWARTKIALAVSASMKKRLKNSNFEEFQEKSVLMKKIVDCVYERAKENMTTTIITYNFDDYFEFAYKLLLKNKGELDKYEEQVSVHTLAPNSHLPSGVTEKLVNIYHVHGCIPIFHRIYGNYISKDIVFHNVSKDMSYEECLGNGIVFSGNDYNQLMDDAIVGWTNMIQYICYSQLPVVMIGFSMSDANFRLLLRRMRKSNAHIKKMIVFWGFDKKTIKGKIKKFREEREKNTEYIFKGLCDKPKCIVKEFGESYAAGVNDCLNEFLE